MKLKLVVILWSISLTVASGSFGYELIQHRLDFLEERFSDTLERLVAAMGKSEEKIDALAAKINLANSRLDSTMEMVSQNQKLLDSQINLIKLNFSEVTNNTRKLLDNQSLIASCRTPSVSGIFKLQLKHLHRNVYCEMETFGGGWLVIQQRIKGFKLNFNRTWSEYRDGFGVVGQDEEFWLGNEAIHQITTSAGDYELALEFKTLTGNYYYARYSQFEIARERDKYRLKVAGYSGTLGDKLIENNNKNFSTYDSDNTKYFRQCVFGWGCGWWYSNCGTIVLNGTPRPIANYFGTYTRMMIRRK